MDFEEWMDSIEANDYDDIICAMGDAFKAGQQSKQVEIDGLEKKLKYEKLAYKNIKLQFLNKQHDLEELQKTNISLEAGLRKNSKNKQKLLGKNIELQKRIDEYEKLATSIRNDFDDLG